MVFDRPQRDTPDGFLLYITVRTASAVKRKIFHAPVSMRVLTVFVCFTIVLCVLPASALSGVAVDDTVALKGEKVMLRAETRGRLFSKGGELVEFFVDGKSIGKTLSGGDGVAFKAFTPVTTGLRQISVKSGENEDDGVLLSLKKGSSIVLFDVEGSLLQGLFSWKPRPGSQKAIKEILKRFPAVYLCTSFVGVRPIKGWLEENEFPKLPVLPWRQGAIFDEIAKKDVKIQAIVGSPKVTDSVKEQKIRVFSFEASAGAEEIKDWETLSRKF
jgi:hypothetical protein